MNILIVGDIVGKSGVLKLQNCLKEIIPTEKIDFTIVNGENSANGKGIRLKEYEQILSYGADAITLGNHIYYRKEMASLYKTLDRLLLPANITNLEGNGCIVVEKNDIKYGVINIIGRACMGDIIEKNASNPFDKVDEEIEKLKKKNVDYIFVDFHAGATAEKIAMGYYLDGKVTGIFGTHTHVQTADEKILENGTAYITDVGMTGPINSIIGLKKEVGLNRFKTGKYFKYECSENESMFNAIIIKTDDNTKKAISIKRINL